MTGKYLRRYLICCFTFSILSFLVLPQEVSAQRGREGFGFRGQRDVSILLLSTRDIRRELDVSREQRRMVDALLTDIQAQKSRRSSSTTAEKLMRVVLREDQSKRLEQLRLQFEGPYAVDDETFSKEIQLTDEQRATVEDLRKKQLISDIKDLSDELGDEPVSKWRKQLGKPYPFAPEISLLREEYFKQRQFIERNPRRRRR